MAISKSKWISVTIFLWGLPTAGLLAFGLSAYSSDEKNFSLDYFQYQVFLKQLIIFIPVFIVLGFALGLIFHKTGENGKDG